MNVRQALLSAQDLTYREWAEGLGTGSRELIGVRLPQVRRLARQLARQEGLGYLKRAADRYYEEALIQGFVIGYAPAGPAERLPAMDSYLALADCWGLCDSAAASWKWIARDPESYWGWVRARLNDRREFIRRSAIVLGMGYYLDPGHREALLESLTAGGADGYYVRMAEAWLLATAAARDPERILKYLGDDRLDGWTHNKAIQKMRESYRVSEQTKRKAERLRRK